MHVIKNMFVGILVMHSLCLAAKDSSSLCTISNLGSSPSPLQESSSRELSKPAYLHSPRRELRDQIRLETAVNNIHEYIAELRNKTLIDLRSTSTTNAELDQINISGKYIAQQRKPLITLWSDIIGKKIIYYDNHSLLSIACALGEIQMITHLFTAETITAKNIFAKPIVNNIDLENLNPLHIAARFWQPKALEYLLLIIAQAQKKELIGVPKPIIEQLLAEERRIGEEACSADVFNALLSSMKEEGYQIPNDDLLRISNYGIETIGLLIQVGFSIKENNIAPEWRDFLHENNIPCPWDTPEV